MFLLRCWRCTGEPHALKMVETTLLAMRAGAIWDAKRSGFHRYADDAVGVLSLTNVSTDLGT